MSIIVALFLALNIALVYCVYMLNRNDRVFKMRGEWLDLWTELSKDGRYDLVEIIRQYMTQVSYKEMVFAPVPVSYFDKRLRRLLDNAR